MVTGVRAFLFRNSSQYRRFLVVLGEFRDTITIFGKVKAHSVKSFSLVEADLDTASSKADSFHLVLVNCGGDDVTGSRHLLKF